ncbi:hypothetical protein MRB53_013191 [Persea americana]|uniref:Uncharacterized protein n=1 Tax=Persea americana TaxID=3435 RepID=A0ACC2K796_PERAE|nr:hypothetical protein MRB53_013191 [Persea americana]
MLQQTLQNLRGLLSRAMPSTDDRISDNGTNHTTLFRILMFDDDGVGAGHPLRQQQTSENIQRFTRMNLVPHNQ